MLIQKLRYYKGEKIYPRKKNALIKQTFKICLKKEKFNPINFMSTEKAIEQNEVVNNDECQRLIKFGSRDKIIKDFNGFFLFFD